MSGEALDQGAFRRMRRNLGWLLGGRGFQAFASLFYLAFAARALGPEGFGAFVLILAYGQAIANVATFQSWQAVVRYGAHHRARGDAEGLDRLLGLTASLDGAGALLGALAALSATSLVGPWLGWSPHQQHDAAIFGAALLLSVGSTPIGLLRLHDRFATVTYMQAVSPVVRFLGAGLGWLLDFGVNDFLIVWAVGALLQAVTNWAVALAATGRRPSFGPRRLARAARENTGILRFMAITNCASTVNTLPDHVGTLLIGGSSGAATAGAFRLASKLTRSMGRPVQLLAVAIFPEFARFAAESRPEAVRRLLARSNRIATLLAAAFVGAMALGGGVLLQLLSGAPHQGAGTYLLLYSVAVAIDLSGFANEPLLTAHGRAGRVLFIRTTGAALHLILLLMLVPAFGALAAAVAAICASACVRIQTGIAVARLNSSAAADRPRRGAFIVPR